MRGLSTIAELLVCMTVTQTDTLSDDCITNDCADFRAQFVLNCLAFCAFCWGFLTFYVAVLQ